MNISISVNKRPPSVTIFIEKREPLIIYEFGDLLKLTTDLCYALKVFGEKD